MAEGPPSFSYLVFGKAVASTSRFFGHSWQRDLILAFVSLSVGFALYWYFEGLPIAMEQVASVIAFTLAPLGAVVLAVFVWNLWLAPAELAYEAACAAQGSRPADAPSQSKVVRSVNWAIWKHRDSYTLPDFAAILAKIDPRSPQKTTEHWGFLDLLKEAVLNHKLFVEPDLQCENYQTPDVYPERFLVKRGEAIEWAKEKGFDLAHIL